MNEYASWTTAEPGDLLYRADTILDSLGFLLCETGSPDEGVNLPGAATEGIGYVLQHVQDLVRCAAAKK